MADAAGETALSLRGAILDGIGEQTGGTEERPQPRQTDLGTLSDEQTRGVYRPVRWWVVAASVVVLTVALALLPGRTSIPPLVESDYCYLLVAADRFVEGHGLTAPPPVAPLQPWNWRADWAFLTQWPCGYPVLIAVARWLFGVTAIVACGWIAVVTCAASLVGWFTWVRRCVPRGAAGGLLAGVAAGCSVSAAFLVNPTTDAILVAALPFVLLCAARAVELARMDADCDRPEIRTTLWLAAAGVAAGGLFWIRYVSVFVPASIGIYLVIEWRLHRRIGWTRILTFGFCAAAPMVSLLLINRAFGLDGSARTQLNLGESAAWDLSPAWLAVAWWNLTDLGFYDYHRFTHWVYALWPGVIVAAAMVIPSVRRRMREFLATPAVGLSASALIGLPAILVLATMAFGHKFNYVGLARYYAPGRPLYFVLFAAPVLWSWSGRGKRDRLSTSAAGGGRSVATKPVLNPVPSPALNAALGRALGPALKSALERIVRGVVIIGLLVACSWIVRQAWPRPYRRSLHASRPITPYGQWATCFEPNAAGLYRWLRGQADANLIVVSNFHEFIALETKIPALPIPPDVATLDTWIGRIRTARGITDPRVLFVLDPDNRWRDYWIQDPADVIATFGLQDRPPTPDGVSALTFTYR